MPMDLENFEVLCGIEEEFLIINEDGILAEMADEMMKAAARMLRKNNHMLETLMVQISGLDAEPNPAQIEYVTLPLPPSELKNAVHAGRDLLITAAEDLGVKILAQSMHPVQSNPNPIAGTHINVSVKKRGTLMTPEQLQSVHNYLWNLLPEIMALSVNSPMYKGSLNGYTGNRYRASSVLKMTGPAKIERPDYSPALLPIQYYGRRRYKLRIGVGDDEFSHKVITNARGNRLVDITPRGPSTNISDDKDDSPTRNRVEVRAIDVQQDVNKVLNLAYLLCASALHAIEHQEDPVKLDENHESNVREAFTNGRNAMFIKDGNRLELEDSVQQWLDDTKKCQDILGFPLDGNAIKTLLAPPAQSKIEKDFQTREIEKLITRDNMYAVVRIRDSRIVRDKGGQKYKVKQGAMINGMLSTAYFLEFEEQDRLVSRFNSIKAVNYIDVQGLQIPLKEGDKVVRVLNESDYIFNRLFGSFGF
ncbi:hypothetical protein GF325_17195 [Candidatus Bathyarchaeota archaeon]|nr:hypothetical protein [Candidatus Bathyarchaeota archaeon]